MVEVVAVVVVVVDAVIVFVLVLAFVLVLVRVLVVVVVGGGGVAVLFFFVFLFLSIFFSLGGENAMMIKRWTTPGVFFFKSAFRTTSSYSIVQGLHEICVFFLPTCLRTLGISYLKKRREI